MSLLGAYAIVWVIVAIGFVVGIWILKKDSRKENELRCRVAALEEEIDNANYALGGRKDDALSKTVLQTLCHLKDNYLEIEHIFFFFAE